MPKQINKVVSLICLPSALISLSGTKLLIKYFSLDSDTDVLYLPDQNNTVSSLFNQFKSKDTLNFSLQNREHLKSELLSIIEEPKVKKISLTMSVKLQVKWLAKAGCWDFQLC